MAQFKAINPAVEVNGQTVLSVSNGLGPMRALGERIMEANGLAGVNPGGWYSQQAWLNAFKAISESVGQATLYKIGTSIPDNAVFPPEIDDIYKALSAIDVAYHMNHCLNGQALFNPASGSMGEGIGHYHFKKVADKVIEVRCDNPYPCDFDRGIVEQMAKRFKPAGAIIKVSHDEKQGCRKTGGEACAYTVTW